MVSGEKLHPNIQIMPEEANFGKARGRVGSEVGTDKKLRSCDRRWRFRIRGQNLLDHPESGQVGRVPHGLSSIEL